MGREGDPGYTHLSPDISSTLFFEEVINWHCARPLARVIVAYKWRIDWVPNIQRNTCTLLYERCKERRIHAAHDVQRSLINLTFKSILIPTFASSNKSRISTFDNLNEPDNSRRKYRFANEFRYIKILLPESTSVSRCFVKCATILVTEFWQILNWRYLLFNSTSISWTSRRIDSFMMKYYFRVKAIDFYWIPQSFNLFPILNLI